MVYLDMKRGRETVATMCCRPQAKFKSFSPSPLSLLVAVQHESRRKDVKEKFCTYVHHARVKKEIILPWGDHVSALAGNEKNGKSSSASRSILDCSSQNMSLNERDTLIVIIVCSIVGFLSLVLIICCCFWCVIRYFRLQSKRLNAQEENDSPVMASSRQHYQRSHKAQSNQADQHYSRTKKKRRFNTNDSAITMSFDPPHLINQNVKNLDRLLNTDPTMTAHSWHYEQTLPSRYRWDLQRRIIPCISLGSFSAARNPSQEPVYVSSSTILTAISNLAVPMQPIADVHQRFLTELDQVLRSKQDDQQHRRPVKYSQSCRQATDLLPFDYYRSLSPSLTIPELTSSEENSHAPIFVRTPKYSNATLLRKARLGQLRDDTAILYWVNETIFCLFLLWKSANTIELFLYEHTGEKGLANRIALVMKWAKGIFMTVDHTR